MLVLIHENRKFGEKCLHPSESSVDYHVDTLKSVLKRKLPMAMIRDPLEDEQFVPNYYETVVQIRIRLAEARAEANKGKPRPRLVRKNKQ